MLGAVVKSYYAEREGIDPKKLFMVSIMPCTAKKFEAARPEMVQNGVPDVDAVLTTRELAKLVRMFNLDLQSIAPEPADDPFAQRSSSGKLFGASGGVMEAAVRTAHYMVTGQEIAEPRLTALRGLKGTKKTRIPVGDLDLGVAVVSGLENARALLEEVRSGREQLHFIEVMACPGGCINGGGQPIGADLEAVRARAQALYGIDRDESLRYAHRNPSLKKLYDEFLGKPLGEKSHHLLHTHFNRREVLL
jgi:iron only hydrogenase large subunit-like protein